MPFVEHFPLTAAILMIIIFLVVLAAIIKVVIHLTSTPVTVKDIVPIQYIPYENEITIYRRSDNLYYQRIGSDTQVQVVRLRDGGVHKLGNPFPTKPNELVQIVEIRHV